MPVTNAGHCKCSPEGRNLVVCIDGTSNKFGDYNTNVVEFYSKIVKTTDSQQLTYYNSGVGTYAESSRKSWLSTALELTWALHIEKIILAAYRWLSENYREKDKIYLFGFSRGAYQVRVLAGMIQRVGLIHKGNEEQIPFAYEIYVNQGQKSEEPSRFNAPLNTAFRKTMGSERSLNTNNDDSIDSATRFKMAFSRKDVGIHFVGVWDTVSSVGPFRGKILPLTDTAKHCCFFRHALALDECRVKFLPEFVKSTELIAEQSTNLTSNSPELLEPHVKEVWFPGTHSDIGGGNRKNVELDLSNIPFLWMSFEAITSGLQLETVKVEWSWDTLGEVKESMKWYWRLLEWVPIKRLTYKDGVTTTRRPHHGHGRKIQPGQKIHSSVAFCKNNYSPKARLPQGERKWNEIVAHARENGEPLKRGWDCPPAWESVIELDIFDIHGIPLAIEKFESKGGLKPYEERMWTYRLAVATSSELGRETFSKIPTAMAVLVRIFNSGDLVTQQGIIDVLQNLYERDLGGRVGDLFLIAREDKQPTVKWLAIKILAHSQLSKVLRQSLQTQNPSPNDRHGLKTVLNIFAELMLAARDLNVCEIAAMGSIFDDTISALHQELDKEDLDHDRYHNRGAVLQFLTDVIAWEAPRSDLRDKIVNDRTIVLLQQLADSAGNLKSPRPSKPKWDTVVLTLVFKYWTIDLVVFFTAAVSQENLRDKVFDTRTISAIWKMLAKTKDPTSTDQVAGFFSAASLEGLQEKIVSLEALSDGVWTVLTNGPSDAQNAAVKIFMLCGRQDLMLTACDKFTKAKKNRSSSSQVAS